MTPQKNLFQNFFSLGLAQGIVSSLQLLVIPFVIKRIGADGFGVVAVAQVVMFYLAVITDYGFNQTAVRKVATGRDDKEKMSQVFSRVLCSKALLCITAFLVLLLLILTVPIFYSHRFVYLTGFSFVVGQTLLMNWFFQGMERMWFILITTFIARAIFVILIFLLVRDRTDDYCFLLFMGTGNIVAGLIGIVLSVRMFGLKLKYPGITAVKEELKEGWHFTFTNLSMNTCQYANVFFLRFFTNDITVGYYSVAERVYFTLKQVLGVFFQAVYPQVCQLVLKTKEGLLHFFKKYYLPFLACIVFGCGLLVVIAPQVLLFLSGDEGIHSIFTLRMMCLVLIITCMNIPATLILLAVDQKRNYFRIFLFACLVNIVANLLLVPRLATNGSLVTIALTELFITAAVIVESTRRRVVQKIGKPVSFS